MDTDRKAPKPRNVVVQNMIARYSGTNAAGPHMDRVARQRDVIQGRSRKLKHKDKKEW